jgi:hypothetical protein
MERGRIPTPRPGAGEGERDYAGLARQVKLRGKAGMELQIESRNIEMTSATDAVIGAFGGLWGLF